MIFENKSTTDDSDPRNEITLIFNYSITIYEKNHKTEYI